MQGAALVGMAIAVIGLFVSLGGLVWKLASLTTRLDTSVAKLAADIARIEPRLVQLDEIAILKKDVDQLKEVQADIASRTAKLDSWITQLRIKAGIHDELRRSQGDFQ